MYRVTTKKIMVCFTLKTMKIRHFERTKRKNFYHILKNNGVLYIKNDGSQRAVRCPVSAEGKKKLKIILYIAMLFLKNKGTIKKSKKKKMKRI